MSNLGGTATLDNTIVALNTSGTGSGAHASDIAGGTVVLGQRVQPDRHRRFRRPDQRDNGNQVGVANPGLGPLANNGGPTQTIALLPGSPAIDAGSNALAVDPTTGQPLTTDQRGPGFVADRQRHGRHRRLRVHTGRHRSRSPSAGGRQTAALQTAADGLRLLPAGRNTDLPWLGIDQLDDHPQPGPRR